jgi:hypothetical protein
MQADAQFTNFTAGQLSPRMKARTDVGKYFNACDSLLNMVVMPQGGATRRPGTLFAAKAGDQANRVRLIPFVFNALQPYVVELGAGYARFYQNDGLIMSGGSPVQISTPYLASELAAIKFVQSADTLYLFHGSHPAATIVRSSNTSWTYAVVPFRDGPYLAYSATGLPQMTVTGGSFAVGATVTLTVVNTIDINGNAGFQAGDVGRHVRIQNVSTIGWAIISAVLSTTSVQAVIQPAVEFGAGGGLDGASPQVAASWNLGAFSPFFGYPYCGTFWQNRLMLGGANGAPNAIWGSVPSDFTNFATSEADGTVTDSNSVSWVISDDQVNSINWFSPAGSAQAMQLGIGVTGAEQIMQPATTSQVLSPTNVQVYRETVYGSSPNVQPLRIGKSVLFPNRPGRKVHEWTFTWQVNGYVGPDISVLSEDETRSGITSWAYQQTPYGVIWMTLADGGLVALTYLREQDVVAWSPQQLGGQYYGGPPIVECVCAIPSPSGAYDEVWFSVLRTIDGVPTRFIEVMTGFFDDQPTEESFFVDAGLSSALTNPAATATPAGFTASQPTAGPATFSGSGSIMASAAVFSSASVGDVLRMNGGIGVVTGFVSTTQVTVQLLAPMNNLAPAAQGAWSLTAPVEGVTGLSHLAGETVAVLGDGLSYGSQVVSPAGGVTLSSPASFVTAGLHTPPLLVTMPVDPQRSPGGVMGRPKRLGTAYVRLLETVGGKVGRRTTDPMTGVVTDRIEDALVRLPIDLTNAAKPPVSTVVRMTLSGQDREGQVLITQPDPLPVTVLAIAMRADIEEVAA